MNMQFVGNRKNHNNQQLQHQQNKNINLVTYSSRNYYQHPVTQVQPKSIEVVTVPKNDPKKIKWGGPTWLLFHTLAHKIKNDDFSKIKVELFTNIVTICRNLPCPKCANHASDYMSRISINSILTKDDLKNMLFKFHNDVNARTGSPEFSYTELNNKYSTAITINIIQNFFLFFKDNSFNVTSIANTMHRERTINVFKQWLQNNIHRFDP
jgi:hypothetical protein